MNTNKVEFKSNKKLILSESKKKKSLILKAIGIKAVKLWMDYIDLKGVVDTSTFKNSTTSEPLENEVIVGSAVEYAPYLEIGTHKMKARPTLEPAVMNHKDTYEELAKHIWEN